MTTDLARVLLLVLSIAPVMWAWWRCCDAMNMGEADGLGGSRYHQKMVPGLLVPFYEYGRKTGQQITDRNKIGGTDV